MNKPNNLYLLGFYIGKEVIQHNIHGPYKLDGFYSKGVMARRNLTGLPEDEEYEMFGFEEVEFLVNPTSESLTKRFSDSIRFIKKKADEGCWVGDKSVNVIFEP